MITLYLDIDGVLITTKNSHKANYADEFIQFIIENFDCYWLTTHCKGDAKPAMDYIKPFFDDETMNMLASVKATNWDTLKTEAIDMNSDFYWIDDYPLIAERKILYDNNIADRLIQVNLLNTNELQRIIRILASRLENIDLNIWYTSSNETEIFTKTNKQRTFL